jgi:hypothetical protein
MDGFFIDNFMDGFFDCFIGGLLDGFMDGLLDGFIIGFMDGFCDGFIWMASSTASFLVWVHGTRAGSMVQNLAPNKGPHSLL